MMSVKKLCSWARGKMRWSYSQATDSCSQRTFHSSSHRATVKVYDESWRPVKEKYLHMDIDEKRQQYFVKGNYLDLDRIRPWPVYFEHMRIPPTSQKRKYPLKFPVNYRVTMGQGNIVAVELDAIVNPTSLDMMGTGGECDKIVHLAAGKELMLECKTLRGCDIGEAKITGGYRLPAKYVIHTVGPVGHHPTVDSLLRKLSQPDAPEQFEDDRISLHFYTNQWLPCRTGCSHCAGLRSKILGQTSRRCGQSVLCNSSGRGSRSLSGINAGVLSTSRVI
ncbi:ADP-ribose glycohydrolase MACROD2 [Folsomia candida]|uniref:ADP-ribose glycohydrolase MACROD2 n=1 Tax=Folsomia candida TaxID=158441 RepID=UPI0016054DD7|nr:ADP-ribose glycohydrolase MACROD2 [Folsomia candida]